MAYEEEGEQESTVIQLLDLVWRNTNRGVSHSWERLNHAMRDALHMAISAGFTFLEGDFEAVATGEYRFGYWSGDSIEWLYSESVASGNMSAVKSFEAWQKREPFIADGVCINSDCRYLHIKNSDRDKERLVVGADFAWKGLKVTVNSFAKDQSYLNAAHYEMKDYRKGKILKRFKITRADIIADRAERKERTKLIGQLREAKLEPKELSKLLGVKTDKALAALPIERIREAVASLTEAA